MDEAKVVGHTHTLKLSNLISKHKQEFINEYRKCDENNRKEIYLQVLYEVHEAISLGNVNILKKLVEFIVLMTRGEKRKPNIDNIYNPFIETNPIILACKCNKVEVIEYIFANEENIIKYLFAYTGSKPLLPNIKDSECHDCFYYAIRSNNVKLLESLIKKWPGDYFVHHSKDLDRIISKSYEELCLKNVPLSTKMKFFIENTLIDLRFFSNISRETYNVQRAKENIRDRIGLVLKYINTLRECYSMEEKVDAKFLRVVKFIASNIRILKQQLKPTYLMIPWEEMEFYLVIFVLFRTTKTEINLYFHSISKKEKLLHHLQCFSECLQTELGHVKYSDIDWHIKLGDFQRNKIIDQISSKYPYFIELYEDYQLIRDVHSLEKMSTYIDLAVSANCWDVEDKLIILRVLQVIGENLKNTLESPKLSNATSNHLSLSVKRKARDIIRNLRDSLSHSESILDIAEIHGDLYKNIQNDIKNIGDEISFLLYKNKINIMKIFLEKFVKCDDLEAVKEMMEAFRYIDFEGVTDHPLDIRRFKYIEKLVERFSDVIGAKTNYEKEMFKIARELIISEKKDRVGLISKYKVIFSTIKCIYESLYCYNLDFWKFRSHKSEALIAIEYTASTEKTDRDIFLLQAIRDIFNSYLARNLNVHNYKMKYLFHTLSNIIKGQTTKGIEIFVEMLDKNTKKKEAEKIMDADNNEYCTQLKKKLSLIEYILERKGLYSQSDAIIPFYIRDKKLQASLEMLLMDILSLLNTSKQLLAQDLFFLDDHLPILVGKCLRNHLAHGNSLMDVLSSDPAIAIISNALKLMSENLIEKHLRIGKLVKDDPLILEFTINQDIEVVTNQEKLFSALEESNYQKLMTCIKNGADIWARDLNMWTSLHFAAKGHSLDIVKYILYQNLDVNAKDINGQNPLHIAAQFGRIHTLQLIMQERTMDFNERDIFGKTPLDAAAQNGHKDVVELLLNHTSKTYKKDVINHGSPLFHALNNNQINVAVFLLKGDKDFYASRCGESTTLLCVAAAKGYLGFVNHFLENNVYLNAEKITPLHSAAENGKLDVVKILISRGLDINAKCRKGWTPLLNAVVCGDEMVVKTLLENGAKVNIAEDFQHSTPLHIAAYYGYKGIVEILLHCKANVNSETVKGMTPLHIASISGQKMIAALLLEHNADVNARDSQGQTALHICSSHKHKDIVNLLLKNGARIHEKDEKNRNSLHRASASGCREIVEILILMGAEIYSIDIYGHTPLHVSALNGHQDVLEFLLEKKALINSRDKKGLTPLHLAVQKKGNEVVVEYLLSKGANKDAKDMFGMTPMHIALKFGNNEVAELLFKMRTEVNLGEQSLSTPLYLAEQENQSDTVDLISNEANVSYGPEKESENSSVDLFTNGANVNRGAAKDSENNTVDLITNGANVNCDAETESENSTVDLITNEDNVSCGTDTESENNSNSQSKLRCIFVFFKFIKSKCLCKCTSS